MTLQEKLGVLYARIDCGGRNCANCGDSDYYMQDVTLIEVTDCEEFEEV